jgi:apolipoprotein N-acyltransferase
VSGALDRAHTQLTRRILGFRSVGVPGADVVLFSLTKGGRTFRYATPICFEITSGEFGRRAAVAGADFFVNLTSEGVLGPAVYTHTWALSTLRAVENRVGVVRVGNNGISGIIDPNGRTRAVLRGKHEGRTYLEEGTLIAPVLVDDFRESFFARHGDVFSYLCITFSAVLLALASRAGRLASRRSSSVSAAGT